jgi:hypothetical protein
MTLSQFAAAVNADPKWVLNATRLLRRPLRRTAADAHWLRLVRLLHHDVGLSLARASRAATRAFRATGPSAIAAESPDGSAAVLVDRARFESSFVAALGTALTVAGPRRRGRSRKPRRDALAAARAYAVDLGLLRASLALSPADRLQRLEENATFLGAVRPAAR